MEIFYIDKNLINQYVNRLVNKSTIETVVFFAIGLILFFLLAYSYEVHMIIMPPLLIIYPIAICILHFLSKFQVSNFAKYTYFKITEDSISYFVDKKSLNEINKFVVYRNERRFGINNNQTIKFDDIGLTRITKNEIILQTTDFGFFSNSGKIIIPKEVEHFEAIKTHIINNAEVFMLID